MTPKELEARVQALEDMEAVKKLQKSYGFYLEHWDGEQVVALFSNDPHASVEIGDGGLYVGKKAITEMFMHGGARAKDFLHVCLTTSDIVDVDPGGKTAKGRFNGLGIEAFPVEGGKRQAIWSLGVWENEYVKEDGVWKIKKLHWNRIFFSPYEDGWAKTPVWERPGGGLTQGAKPPRGPNTVYAPYPSGYVMPYHYKNPVTGK